MLLHTINTQDNLLRTDLTVIVTDPNSLDKSIYAGMRDLCKSHGGIGLAANQTGLRENLFFLSAKLKVRKCPGGVLCLNPSWEPHIRGKKYRAEGEGCLSIPGRYFVVERWDRITARWQSTSGEWVTAVLTGTAAQAFQHEHDHLRGKTLLETSSSELQFA